MVLYSESMTEELIKKIISKKEFSFLPEKDVELALKKFDKKTTTDYEKLKLTRDFLRKVYSGFTSQKILNGKYRDWEWVLKKHLSTRERFDYYEELYKRILSGFKKNITVVDLGCGVNGFSFSFLREVNRNISFIGVEEMGQLVNLMNIYFKKEKFNARAIHESLFSLRKIHKILKDEKKPRIVFLFKVIDSLELFERDYSKRLLKEIISSSEMVVLSFATRSMIRRTQFKAKRNWIVQFIKNEFELLDDFVLGGERYLVFR